VGGGVGPFEKTSAAGGVAADAPPAIAKDIPAAPHTGNVVPRRFRFEAGFARAIQSLPNTCERMLDG
jgi:hypothetical protein